MASRTEN